MWKKDGRTDGERKKPSGSFVTLCEASLLYASPVPSSLDCTSFSCCRCPWALVLGCQGLLGPRRIWHALNTAHCLHANGVAKPS